MPIDYSKYAANWREISQTIRERAANKCEFCGIANYTLYWTEITGQRHVVDEVEAEALRKERVKISKVVLTVAHLNHDVTDNSEANLKALCQKCHLRYDVKHHATNAAKTRADKVEAKRRSTGQLEMFGDAL